MAVGMSGILARMIGHGGLGRDNRSGFVGGLVGIYYTFVLVYVVLRH